MVALRRWSACVVLGVAVLATAANALAVEITHVGSIRDGLTAPTSLSVSDDHIAVLEPFSGQTVVYSTAGVVESRVSISPKARSLARLAGDEYLFCETLTDQVIKVDLRTGSQSVFLGGVGEPVDVVVAAGMSRVLDAAGTRILECDSSGRIVKTIPLAVPTDLSGAWLSDLAWDASRAVYYAWDQTHSRVLVFTASGEFTGEFCSYGAVEGTVTRGGEIVCDRDGWLYVSDRYQGRVAVFDSAREFVTFIHVEAADGETLAMPAGLAVDATGLVYVACTETPAIEVYHIDKSAGPLQLPRAIALNPAPGDTISGHGQDLAAGIDAPAGMVAGLSAEFRIYALPDTTTPVAQSPLVPVRDAVVAGDRAVGTARWPIPDDLVTGTQYGWSVRAAADGGTGEWAFVRPFTKGAVPSVFRLDQNVPNPFNPQTTISFALTGGQRASLAVFNLRGQQIWLRSLSDLGPGPQQVVWDGRDDSGATMPSGIYFYRLSEGTRIETRKMVLMK